MADAPVVACRHCVNLHDRVPIVAVAVEMRKSYD